LTDGFHDSKADENLRWANGNAALPAEAFTRFNNGPVEMVVTLGSAIQ
jgi:hypothetical protein